ncbi:MAG: hypothetical protein CMJ87_13175 [Planctomycetes bacterium]|nr:hypothetical protein [Planctomycetota bacterium]
MITSGRAGMPPITRSHGVKVLILLGALSVLAEGCADDQKADGDTAIDDDTVGDDDDSSAIPVELIVETDVPYPPPSGGEQEASRMDLYHLPDGEPKRLLVFVHGGSWIGGDKANLESAPSFVPWFIERDFVVAALNFRLANPLGQELEVSYAEQCADIAAALAWLRDHSGEYGVTEPAVVLLGYSSGAHLVALLAADVEYLQAAGLSQTDLAAVISFDVHAYDVPYALELMAGSDVEHNIPLIEHLFGATEPEQRIGSPSTYAPDTALPRSLLVSAEPSQQEGTHGYIASHATGAYADLLQAAGHDATFVHFDDETHATLVMDFGVAGDGPTATVEAFLD